MAGRGHCWRPMSTYVTGPGAIFTAQSRGPPRRVRGDRSRARLGQKEALRRALQNCHPSLRKGIKRLGLGYSDQAAAGRDRPVIVVSGFSARVRLSPLPRTVSWLGRRRDRPGDFSIKSTKVQNFADAITDAKRPQSLNSANRTKRDRKPALGPRDGRARGLSSA
jgi:hypothetical protein